VKTIFLHFLSATTAKAIVLFAQLITAVRGIWAGVEPVNRCRIYYANHRSHGDFVLVWTVLPPSLRRQTRPVAGSDYWLKGRLRSFIGKQVFNAVLIERNGGSTTLNPVEQMAKALKKGNSLILFPEGTRNTTDNTLLPFKSGLYHLAHQVPQSEIVPVWIDNLNHVMPKGEVIPVPLVCTVTFGEPVELKANENKNDFLKRAESALLRLAPTTETDAAPQTRRAGDV